MRHRGREQFVLAVLCPERKNAPAGIFRARGLQGNVDKMGWSRCVEEYMRQGPGMPGPYGAMENCMGGFKERWAGGMYAAPTLAAEVPEEQQAK